MKFLPILIFLSVLSCEPSNTREQKIEIATETVKAKNIHDLQYLFPPPVKADNIVLLEMYNTFGEYREAVVYKFCKEVEEDVYLQFQIESTQLTLPIMRPYCGEDLKLKDRNRYKIFSIDDIPFYEKHLLNYGKEKNLSEDPQEAFLLIYLKDQSPVESLQIIIIGIVKTYEKIIDKQCQLKYSKGLLDCSDTELRKIFKEIPFRVATRSLPEGEML